MNPSLPSPSQVHSLPQQLLPRAIQNIFQNVDSSPAKLLLYLLQPWRSRSKTGAHSCQTAKSSNLLTFKSGLNQGVFNFHLYDVTGRKQSSGLLTVKCFSYYPIIASKAFAYYTLFPLMLKQFIIVNLHKLAFQVKKITYWFCYALNVLSELNSRAISEAKKCLNKE